jgi:hypothetical protein
MGEKRIVSAKGFFGEKYLLLVCHVVTQEGTVQARRSLIKVLDKIFVVCPLTEDSLHVSNSLSAVLWIPGLISV